jgi:RNA ligase (TIGR02306 family)
MTERKLASIQRIAEVKDIPDADLIQAYRVQGWWVVGKKGEFTVGELVTYIEIDSFVPTELASFLSKGKEPREYMSIRGERLKTVKLKKQISQGLILPLSPYVLDNVELIEGLDITGILGIIKWEAPEEFIPANAKGNFPSFIPKTDQERVQNLSRDFNIWLGNGSVWQKTEKLDGSSMTVFVNADHSGVCSRNLELLEDENNTYWKMTKKYKLLEILRSTGRNLAIQGEIYGTGINGNLYGLDDQRFALYSIYDIDDQSYLPPDQAYRVALVLGVPHVPHEGNLCLGEFYSTMQELIDSADGTSCVNTKAIREGYVYKNLETNESFKVIGASYLIKKG